MFGISASGRCRRAGRRGRKIAVLRGGGGGVGGSQGAKSEVGVAGIKGPRFLETRVEFEGIRERVDREGKKGESKNSGHRNFVFSES